MSDRALNTTSNRLSGRIRSGLVIIGLLALMTLWAREAAEFTWYILDGETQRSASEDRQVQAVSQQRNENRQSGFSIQAMMGMFGVVSAKRATDQSAAVTPTEAPKTRLQLELKGVVAADRHEDAGAIILAKGRNEDYFSVGDDIHGQATLIEVYADRVILNSNGRREALHFSEQDGSKRNFSKVAAQRPARIETPKEFVDVAAKRLERDPQGALNSVGLQAVKAGASEGYVFNGNNPMLRRLNLKQGDVIKSVNGMPLGNIQQDRMLLKRLYEQGNVEVEVERDGTFFSVSYPLR